MIHKNIHRSTWAVFALLLSLTVIQVAFSQPKLPDKDRIRLAEAFRLNDSLGNQLWKDWAAIPFCVLLVAEETEYLLHHPSPDSSFSHSGYDSLLKTQVYSRPRTFPISLLASFPFDGVPTTVIGQAENTESGTSTPWVITLLHEHFHQLQYSQNGYYDQTEKLGISGGDQTGMWMLNYPFPYDSAEVQAAFDLLKVALGDAVNAPDSMLSKQFLNYCSIRRDFMGKLSEPDRKYMSLQLWQEGVARYTELRVAEWAESNDIPTAMFQGLEDYEPIASFAEMKRNIIRNAPYKISLGQFQRTCFYIIGSSEAYLLDRADPAWRDGYFTQMLTLDPYFEKR
jgi:hypothetical protein